MMENRYFFINLPIDQFFSPNIFLPINISLFIPFKGCNLDKTIKNKILISENPKKSKVYDDRRVVNFFSFII